MILFYCPVPGLIENFLNRTHLDPSVAIKLSHKPPILSDYLNFTPCLRRPTIQNSAIELTAFYVRVGQKALELLAEPDLDNNFLLLLQ